MKGEADEEKWRVDLSGGVSEKSGILDGGEWNSFL